MTGSVFAVLTLIVPPAVLANACAVLALTTAGRAARVVDRERDLCNACMAAGRAPTSAEAAQLTLMRDRALLLVRAQSATYVALGGFVLTALISVLGVVLGERDSIERPLELVALAVGVLATAALAASCTLLVRETILTVRTLRHDYDAVMTAAPGSTRRHQALART